MAIFYVNGISEEKINETETYVGFSEVSPAYTVDLAGSKVFDNDFVDPVYSSVNPAYNNQKPTFYPFVSSIAGQSVNVAGNTQDPHDNSATVIRVTNDSSSVRSGLFNVVTGKWDSTYVPTTYGYGLCEDREDTLTYASQDKEYSINTTELTPCDQSTLILPAITPPTPAPAGKVVRYGDAATDPSITLDSALYVGSMYLENNASTHPISIAPYGTAFNLDRTFSTSCNTPPYVSGLFIAAYTTLDNSITYFGANWLTDNGVGIDGPAEHVEFNPSSGASYTTQAIIPEELRDKGPLKVDFYTNCNLFVTSFGHENWDTQYWNDPNVGYPPREDITTRNRITGYSPELINFMANRTQHLWLEGYLGDGSEFNFSTWPDNIRSITTSGRNIGFSQCPNLTNHNVHQLVGMRSLQVYECPGFFDNFDSTNFDLKGVSGGSSGPQLLYGYPQAYGFALEILATDNSHIPPVSFIQEYIDNMYQQVVIDQPFMSSHGVHLKTSFSIDAGYSNTIPPFTTLSNDTKNKIGILQAAPYSCLIQGINW